MNRRNRVADLDQVECSRGIPRNGRVVNSADDAGHFLCQIGSLFCDGPPGPHRWLPRSGGSQSGGFTSMAAAPGPGQLRQHSSHSQNPFSGHTPDALAPSGRGIRARHSCFLAGTWIAGLSSCSRLPRGRRPGGTRRTVTGLADAVRAMIMGLWPPRCHANSPGRRSGQPQS